MLIAQTSLKFLTEIYKDLLVRQKYLLHKQLLIQYQTGSLGELNYIGTMGQITVKVIGIIVLRRSKALKWRMVKLDDRAE